VAGLASGSQGVQELEGRAAAASVAFGLALRKDREKAA